MNEVDRRLFNEDDTVTSPAKGTTRDHLEDDGFDHTRFEGGGDWCGGNRRWHDGIFDSASSAMNNWVECRSGNVLLAMDE